MKINLRLAFALFVIFFVSVLSESLLSLYYTGYLDINYHFLITGLVLSLIAGHLEEKYHGSKKRKIPWSGVTLVSIAFILWNLMSIPSLKKRALIYAEQEAQVEKINKKDTSTKDTIKDYSDKQSFIENNNPSPIVPQVRDDFTDPDAISEEKRITIQKLARNMYSSARDSNWESFEKISNKLELMSPESPEVITVSLMTAVMNNAPLSLIKTLIAKGAKMNFLILIQLVLTDNVPLTKAMMNLGLDIHQKAPNGGGNALTSCLLNYQSPKMFLFLLENNLSIESSKLSNDPLSIILSTVLNNGKIHSFYITNLFKYGVKVLDKHRKLLTKIMLKNDATYKILTNKHPELLLVQPSSVDN